MKNLLLVCLFALSSVLGIGQILNSPNTPGISTSRFQALGDGRYTGVTNNDPLIKLAHWFQGGIANKKIAFLGDSTTDLAFALYEQMFTVTHAYGTGGSAAYGINSSNLGPLPGMVMADDYDGGTEPTRPITFSTTNILNLGQNGQTAAGFISNTSTVTPYPGLAYCAALKPDLAIISFLINDYRVSTTLPNSYGIGLLTNIISTMTAANPNISIVLRMPNPSANVAGPGGVSYFQNGQTAQGLTTSLYQIYRAMEGLFPNVYVYDTMDRVYGGPIAQTTSLNGAPTDPTSMNADQLHPSPHVGYPAIANDMASLIGAPIPPNLLRAQYVQSIGSQAPYLLYPRACENPYYYDLILQGTVSTIGSNYLYFGVPFGSGFSPASATRMQAGDIVVQDGQNAFAFNGGVNLNGTNTVQLVSLGLAPAAIYGGYIQVYRHKFGFDQNWERYWADTVHYPYRVRFNIASAGNGYIRLLPFPGETAANLRTALTTSDILCGSGQAPLTLTGASFSTINTNQLQIAVSGVNFATLYNLPTLAIFGNHAFENGSTYPVYTRDATSPLLTQTN